MNRNGQRTQEPPDLWREIERRLAERPHPRRVAKAPVVATGVAIVVFAASGVLLWRAFGAGDEYRRPAAAPLDAIAAGWTRLPDPPEDRPSAAYVWTGSRLLAWGGCDPSASADCTATRDGFAYDPAHARWSQLPPAPTAVISRRAVWTGSEAVFLAELDGRLGGLAYEPASQTWRTIADAPTSWSPGAVVVLAGSRIFVWGGGERSAPVLSGELYDPATDTWTSVSRSPIGLNLAGAVWTGREVIVFGSFLNSGNHAETRTAVGAAYNPTTDTWRTLAASRLSPQADAVAWTGDRMVAWDYAPRSQNYDPASDSWTDPERLPFEPSECYPDSAVVAGDVFAFYCGEAAVYDPAVGTWSRIHGGLLNERIWSDAYQRSIQLWRFADMIPAGDVLFLAAEGITLTNNGEACYGCAGSPRSLWVYRPTPSSGEPATSG